MYVDVSQTGEQLALDIWGEILGVKRTGGINLELYIYIYSKEEKRRRIDLTPILFHLH